MDQNNIFGDMIASNLKAGLPMGGQEDPNLNPVSVFVSTGVQGFNMGADQGSVRKPNMQDASVKRARKMLEKKRKQFEMMPSRNTIVASSQPAPM
jgi:hypothetical protein